MCRTPTLSYSCFENAPKSFVISANPTEGQIFIEIQATNQMPTSFHELAKHLSPGLHGLTPTPYKQHFRAELRAN
jgi:hypothetical protein